jgi:hypothetical protein
MFIYPVLLREVLLKMGSYTHPLDASLCEVQVIFNFCMNKYGQGNLQDIFETSVKGYGMWGYLSCFEGYMGCIETLSTTAIVAQ